MYPTNNSNSGWLDLGFAVYIKLFQWAMAVLNWSVTWR